MSRATMLVVLFLASMAPLPVYACTSWVMTEIGWACADDPPSAPPACGVQSHTERVTIEAGQTVSVGIAHGLGHVPLLGQVAVGGLEGNQVFSILTRVYELSQYGIQVLVTNTHGHVLTPDITIVYQ